MCLKVSKVVNKLLKYGRTKPVLKELESAKPVIKVWKIPKMF